MKKVSFIQTNGFIKVLIVFSLVIFIPNYATTQVRPHKSLESNIRMNGSTVIADLMDDHFFVRGWFYHELLSNESLSLISSNKKIIEINSESLSSDSLLKLTESLYSKAVQMSEDFDKEVKGNLMRSCAEIHGEMFNDFVYYRILEEQSDSCHKSSPFCTGTIYSFPAGVNSGQGEVGPNYGCLGGVPNPVWYHMKILQSGDITIRMKGTKIGGQDLDIDFALWGPYSDPVNPCTSFLTANCTDCPNNTSDPFFYPSGNLHDCSFSSSDIENAHIVDGVVGQYYIMIITNWDNDAGNITFEKVGGDGTTDCTILPPPASSNSPICVSNTIQLTAASVGGATYNWSGPNNFISNQQNPTIPNAQYSHSGTYTLTITVNGNMSEPTTTEVLVIDPPVAELSAGSNTTFCYGDSVKLVVTTTSVGPFTAQISSGGGMPAILSFDESPGIIWLTPGSSKTYTLAGISNAGCAGTASGSVDVTVRPAPAAGFSASNLCAGLSTSFTDETTIASGTINEWNWNFGDGSANSNLQNPTHIYSNTGNFNVTLEVTSNFNCSSSISFPHTIKPTPNVNAGVDKTINYGTTTTLSGTASGGSGTHTYQWQPANKVVNPSLLDTDTQIMEEATQFSLTATDANGCQKSDAMQLSIVGGPLNCNIEVTNPEVCKGNSTSLKANASGGAGPEFYEFEWESEPAGFNSNLQEITVSPQQTTKFTVHIFDGFTNINRNFTVVVNENPVVATAADMTIPHGTSTLISCNVTGDHGPYTYLWSPANLLETPNAQATQTVNLYESKVFSVGVTDTKGCTHSDVMSVTISGEALAVAVQAESPICRNTPTRLITMVGGGNTGNETPTYSWTDQNGTFVSNEAQPLVSPDYTTTYTVKVWDGFNEVEGSFKVVVNQLPVIDLIPDNPKIVVINATEPFSIGACVFDSIQISAGNQGAQFLWSNGSVEQGVTASTSGIIYDEQNYNVVVTDPLTTCSNTAHLTIYFTFSNCSYGIEEEYSSESGINIFPNPNEDGIFNLRSTILKNDVFVDVFNLQGKVVYNKVYKGAPTGELDEVIVLQDQPVGIYILRLQNQNKTVVKKLIIK